MHGRFRALCAGTLLVAAACSMWFPLTAAASSAYNGTRGLLRTRSADTYRKGTLSFQLSAQYGKLDNQLLSPGGYYPPGDTSAVVDYHLFIPRVSITYALSDFFEVAGNLDVRSWIRTVQEDNGHNDLETFTRGGLGDTDVSAKLSIPLPGDKFKLGAYGDVNFKTGDKDRRFTTDSNDITVLGLATLDLTDMDTFVPTRVHVNAGYRFNKNELLGYGIFDPDFPDSSGFNPPGYPATPAGENDSYNDNFLFNAALEFPAPQVTFFVEFDWQNLLNMEIPDGASVSANTYTLTPGVEFKGGSGSSFELGADINLNSGDRPSVINAPDWGLWMAFNYVAEVIPRDSDKDGIADPNDGCPDQPEDFDGYQDADGCPDLDNDGDGLNDKDDMCPDLAEDYDSFQDGDGCPDLDNDQDGIPDASDKCPDEAEDLDGEADDDGCPDLVKDSDNDGVPDDLDRCPLQAEDFDGYQDDDGCPDLDNDLDGIPDNVDKCPTQPETFNGVDDEDGCPDAKEIGKQFVLRGIGFESGSAALTPDSYTVLDQVIASMNAYPEARLEIRGHTDSQGPANFNLELSQRRAESVRQYLIKGGVDPSRLTSVGVGEEEPIASNATPDGRSQNRRIEFRRLN
ncbi:MAG: OmpA family protein [Candidatus Krumholzibacteria bacterium]|nr:OmpA family protein [Candidatus Krumholzibacteria bacterium]MDH4336340.1 OmpA family protein [Candidatus Krumholzibacteria bacterium]MDH5270510.1 OmpA family protein [Candidatus Krumholzibacteria bacterium]MDH5627210.1 OmpA family protein [Candidatus Krumholzibacteria bacterium]